MGAAVLVASLPAGVARAAPATYVQPVFGANHTPKIDVLVVPPVHGPLYNDENVLDGPDPMTLTPFNSYVRAAEDAIEAWERAVDRIGPRWLSRALDIEVYVLGRDVPPQDALEDPEVVAFFDETKGVVLGFGIWSSTEEPCLLNSSSWLVYSFTYADMYNVIAQEFGHCIGLGHVEGPLRDPYAADVPTYDPMNGQYRQGIGNAGNRLNCVSNLNIAGLERAFGPFAPTTVALYPDVMRAAEYRQIDCERRGSRRLTRGAGGRV
jgi:hypothetical protein